jgi:hypothetical protein
MVVLGGTIVGGAAVAFRPRTLGASVSAETVLGAERAMAMETLADVLRRSARIIAVHDRPGAPFTDIVIQAFDGPRRGIVEPGEVLVLTHSRTLRAVMAFTLDPARVDASTARNAFDEDVIAAGGFARTWRDRPDVRRDVVPAGTGLVRIELEPAEGPGNATGAGWIMKLTWADGSADGTVTGEVRVDLAGGGP